MCLLHELTLNAASESTSIVVTKTYNISGDCPSTPWILTAAMFTIALLLGFFSGILLMAICSKARKKKKRQNVIPVYEYVTSKDILLESNRCYTTIGAPELPKPRNT